MTKKKFELTSDLVKIEDEPATVVALPRKEVQKAVEARERLTADIDSNLKQRLQLLSVQKRRNLREIIESALTEYVEKEGGGEILK